MSWKRNGHAFLPPRNVSQNTAFPVPDSCWAKSSFCFPVLVYVSCLSTGSSHTSSGSLKSLLLNFSLLCTCKIFWCLSHDSWNFLLIFALGCLYCVWLGFVAVTGFNNLYPRSHNCNEHNFYKSLICGLLFYSVSVSSILGSTQFLSFHKKSKQNKKKPNQKPKEKKAKPDFF